MGEIMDKKTFEFIMKEGEGQFIEFKERFSGDLAKEMTAFANSTGGKIFLGISDNGKIKGIDITNKLKSEVQDIARNCDPNIKININAFDNVLIVEVEEGSNKPYSCSSGFYLRVGPNSQKMKREEIFSLAKEEGKMRFEEKINSDFNIEEDFDNEKFKSFLEKSKITDNLSKLEILKNLDLLERGNLKNAGILFFGKRITKFFK
ncbi:MAG: RNA-binding domain-containing protein, partial [Nanoarchaeota archaeon]